MSVIYGFRGANGSGKSTLVRQLMKHIGVVADLTEPSGKVWGYELQNNIRVLGRYETQCGGVDAIKEVRVPGQSGFVNTRKGITLLASLGHVIFEGVLWSTVFKSSDLIARALPQHHFIFAMLDTPAEVCIERVRARRLEKGNHKPFNPRELLSKVEQIRRRQEDLKKAGYDTRTIPYQSALSTVCGWLAEEGVLIQPPV
jgi:hypothetical protein